MRAAPSKLLLLNFKNTVSESFIFHKSFLKLFVKGLENHRLSSSKSAKNRASLEESFIYFVLLFKAPI